MSAELQRALFVEANALRAIAVAEERMKALNDFYAQLDLELEQFAEARLEAVLDLRRMGWSYARIALATRLSKARVAQLSRAAGLGGRV